MKIGYARCSTLDQNPALQIDALRKAGCEKIFTDEGVSGAATKRPQLDACLKALKKGDVLTVWRLDRLGRSLSHLMQITKHLGDSGVGFQSLSEAIDTTSATGKLLLHLLGAVAEFERSLIVERTKAGRAAAVRRGVRFGRMPTITPKQAAHARKMRDAGEAVPDIAAVIGCSRYAVYRALRAA